VARSARRDVAIRRFKRRLLPSGCFAIATARNDILVQVNALPALHLSLTGRCQGAGGARDNIQECLQGAIIRHKDLVVKDPVEFSNAHT
jgi:hypothetical protein